MAMRAGRKPGAAHIADRLSPADGVPFADREGTQMSVQCHISVVMIEDHAVPITAVYRSFGHCSPIRGHDHRTAVGRDIDPVMRFPSAGDRVATTFAASR